MSSPTCLWSSYPHLSMSAAQDCDLTKNISNYWCYAVHLTYGIMLVKLTCSDSVEPEHRSIVGLAAPSMEE